MQPHNQSRVSFIRNVNKTPPLVVVRHLGYVLSRLRVVNLVAPLAALVRPREMCDGNDKEAVVHISTHPSNQGSRDGTYLFELSAIPASALYHAANAAMSPKAPPATIHPPCGFAPSFWRYPIPSRRNAMSSVKKRKKNATVDRSVHKRRMVVKINQPIKKSPKELRKADSPPSFWRVLAISNPPGVRMMAKESQKPPYEERAVAPKVLPTAISLVTH
jgi:hypothetical protein